jgi:hypothetical protein
LLGAAAVGSPSCSNCALVTSACQPCFDCTGVCCPDSVLPTSCSPNPAECMAHVNAACGGSVARVKYSGNYIFPSDCQVKCNSFTTYHHVGAPDMDPPSCSFAAATAYCANHMGYTTGNVHYSACPM